MLPDLRDRLPELLGPHDVNYTDEIAGSTAVPRPEGRYPGSRRILVRPLRRTGGDGELKRNRVAGTTIHEMGHGLRLSAAQRQDYVDLFEGTGWRNGPYWEQVNEAFCYWLTRLGTDGRLVSPYEGDTRDLPRSRHEKFLEILLGDARGGRDDPDPIDPEPNQDDLAAMLQRAEAAERQRDELLAWQRDVREVVGSGPE
jgi:hypothetical protein